MVLSKSTKERNKTLMVMRFAYGFKNASSSSKTQEGQPKQGQHDLQSNPECNIDKLDKRNFKGKRQSLKGNENGPGLQTPSTTNRTQLSITHASFVSDSIDGGIPLIDVAGAGGQKLHLKKETCVLIEKESTNDKALRVRSSQKAGGQLVEHGQSKVTCESIATKDNIIASSQIGNKDAKDNISNMIKEIESIPLVNVEKDKTVDMKYDNGHVLSDSEQQTHHPNIGDSPKQGNKVPSPLLSRLSTESRISDSTSTSRLSNNSKSSRKSLADKIIERRSDNRLSVSQCSSAIDNESVDLPTTVAGSSSCDVSHCLSDNSVRASEVCSDDMSVIKIKHSPDLIPKDGENSQPIMRRRRPRRILTAE